MQSEYQRGIKIQERGENPIQGDEPRRVERDTKCISIFLIIKCYQIKDQLTYL